MNLRSDMMSRAPRALTRGAAISTLNLGYGVGLYWVLGAWYGGCGVIFLLHRS